MGGNERSIDRSFFQRLATKNPHPHPQTIGTTPGALHPDAGATLSTLLAARLPSHADEVAAAVDRARRELAVEHALARVDAAWAALTLVFAPHPPTSTPLVTVPPALEDALEADAVALQSLASGKLAQANADFGARVGAWQARLSSVDALLSVWTLAQRKWTALHAIFSGSADLRATLPDACARFDTGDAAFRAVAAGAPSVPLAVDAAAVPGRRERLEAVLRDLEAAESALQRTWRPSASPSPASTLWRPPTCWTYWRAGRTRMRL